MQGIAFVAVKDDVKIHSYFFPIPGGTNNTAEINAVLNACEWALIEGYKNITIHTDSKYVIGTASQGWKRKKNIELLSQLDEAMKGLNIEFRYVKGHAGNKWNELCDSLAVTATFIT